MEKKGDEKYYLVISLVMGALIIAIAIFFLFQEYFNTEDIDLETCRQSIVLRANAFEIPWGAMEYNFAKTSLKDKFPLRCKTSVINIDYRNATRAEKAFADMLAGCFYLTGSGRYQLFPSTWVFSDSTCMVCARMHFDESVRAYYDSNPIDFRKALNMQFDETQTYWEYIRGTDFQKATEAIIPVHRGAERFDIKDGRVYEPVKFLSEEGDVLAVVSSLYDGIDFQTFLVFLQQNDLEKLDNTVLAKKGIESATLCNSFETIPA